MCVAADTCHIHCRPGGWWAWLPLPAHVVLFLEIWRLFLMCNHTMGLMFQSTKHFHMCKKGTWVPAIVWMSSIDMSMGDKDNTHSCWMGGKDLKESPEDKNGIFFMKCCITHALLLMAQRIIPCRKTWILTAWSQKNYSDEHILCKESLRSQLLCFYSFLCEQKNDRRGSFLSK